MKINKRNKILIVVFAAALIAGLIYAVYNVAMSSGRSKFINAISDLRATNPDPIVNNPCLGTSVLRNYSYIELSQKSEYEIKRLIMEDPGSC
jgi:hypothetical protein